MVMCVWLETLGFLAGSVLWLTGIILKNSSVATELAATSANAKPFTNVEKMRLGLRVLEAIYCVKGSVSLARVFFIAIALNLFLYNLLHFAGLGMLVVQQMIKAGAPPEVLPKSLLETLGKVWRTIDLTDPTVVLSICFFFGSAIIADLITVYATLGVYKYALRKNNFWPFALTVLLLGVFFYVVPYLYLDHSNKPYLAYLLSKDYLHLAFSGTPGAQIFFISDAFAYRQIIFHDQKAFELLGILGPVSAALPVALVVFCLPLSLIEKPRVAFTKLRAFISRRNPDLLTNLGVALVSISAAAATITGVIAAIDALHK